MNQPTTLNISNFDTSGPGYHSAPHKIIEAAFGGEENVPSIDGVRIQLSFMNRHSSYRGGIVGVQLMQRDYRYGNMRRSVGIQRDGRIDCEKIRNKYKEVLDRAEDVENLKQKKQQRETEKRENVRSIKTQLAEVFTDSSIFSKYTDEPFQREYSSSENLNREIVEGSIKAESDGVTVEFEGLSVEETQKVVEFVMNMRK